MKWLGEHIWDFISRFRNDVYLELTSKLYFRDTNSYINSPTANDIEIVATDIILDAANVIGLEATTAVTGSLQMTDLLSVGGGLVATTVLADDGSIPVIKSLVVVDAGGSARTGIRFTDGGRKGEFLFVQNIGGETLTFHPDTSTCLVRGLTTSLDTMEPTGVYYFVSDGTYWNFIGGGTFPGEGLTAS